MDSGDPLLALRHAIKSKTSVTFLANGQPVETLLAATHLALSPALTLPKSSLTRYTKPGISNPSSSADVYTLEAVYLAWLLRDAPGAEYMRQTRESGLTVGFVSVTERKSLVEWLEGKVADLERIRPLASGAFVCPFVVNRRWFIFYYFCCMQDQPHRQARLRVGQGQLVQHLPRHLNMPPIRMVLTLRRRKSGCMSLTRRTWKLLSE